MKIIENISIQYIDIKIWIDLAINHYETKGTYLWSNGLTNKDIDIKLSKF